MSRVQIVYRTVVYVEVETDTGEVLDATVADELTENDIAAGESMVISDDFRVAQDRPATLKEHEAAVAIAESPEVVWPSWSLGW